MTKRSTNIKLTVLGFSYILLQLMWRLENSCPNQFSVTALVVLYLEQKISTGEKVVKIHNLGFRIQNTLEYL
jgi:hypothetical protein